MVIIFEGTSLNETIYSNHFSLFLINELNFDDLPFTGVTQSRKKSDSFSNATKSFEDEDEDDSNGFSVKDTSRGDDGVKMNQENLRSIPKVTKNLERTQYFSNDTMNNRSKSDTHQLRNSESSSSMPESYSHGR